MITPIIDPSIQRSRVYTQIYKYIKKGNRNRTFAFHDKLPSTRTLAAHLQVSRNTIDMAYGQLIDEGYIEARPKRGFFVCDISSNLMSIPASIPEQPQPQASTTLL